MKMVLKSESPDCENNASLRERLTVALQSRIQNIQALKAPVNTEPPRYSGPLFSSSFQSELQWLAGDFKTERQWKREQMKKIGKELIKYLATRETQETKLRKIALSVSKEVERYWRSVAEVVKHRSKKRKAVKVKEEKSRKLEYLVNKTEMFMGKVVTAMLGHRKPKSSIPSPAVETSEVDLTSEEELDPDLESPEASGPEAADSASPRISISNSDADQPVEEMPPVEMDTGDVEDSASSSSSEGSSGVSEELAALNAAQPVGTTLASSSVSIPVPSLLRGQLRDYQHIGLQWLAALGDRIPGKILGDEPGLGKTYQSIALLAHLACAEGIWGPHLVVVPTSVLLNWEIEFKKFCPGMKVMVYFGSKEERANLRVGWNKANAFHVVITSYSIVLQDSVIFKRRRWYYMILDEAHNIKNFKSQRWQTLLTFNTERRLLLTGTPLSNDISDLWALLHFLVPDVFESHTEFAEWFGAPLKAAAEKQQLHLYQELIGRLQAMLRPFLLRRLKRDVEKQMPSKYEHVIKCPLSKRQRILYDEFIGLKETRSQLANASYLGMMNVLMQLRKVCNHPDLFQDRPVKAPFIMGDVATRPAVQALQAVASLQASADSRSDLLKRLAFIHASLRDPIDSSLRLQVGNDGDISGRVGLAPFRRASDFLRDMLASAASPASTTSATFGEYVAREYATFMGATVAERKRRRGEILAESIWQVEKDDHLILSAQKVAVCRDLFGGLEGGVHLGRATGAPMGLPPLIQTIQEQAHSARIDEIYFVQSRALASSPQSEIGGLEPSVRRSAEAWQPAMTTSKLLLPDKRFLEWDCGKLKVLNSLLRRLYTEGHKCIIFTQMSKMLDILEAWINTQSYTYVRLDGGTKVDVRQALIDKFNGDPKVFLFISSTRTSGTGITLTAADCVIMYDSDWSAAMDKQACDRAHRISQTRDVHVYRLISEYTVEENIFRKQLQKRAIDEAVIDGGKFNEASMETWSAGDVKQILELDGADVGDIYGTQTLFKQLDASSRAVETAMAQVEDEEDVKAMQTSLKEAGEAVQPDLDDFVSKEEKAFMALPAIVKAGVRFLEEVQAHDGEHEDDGDHDDVGVMMEGWESDDELERK